MKTSVNRLIGSVLLFVVIATSFLYSADAQAQYGYRPHRHRPVVVCPPPPVYYAPPPPVYYAPPPPPVYYRPAPPPPVVIVKPRPHRRWRRW